MFKTKEESIFVYSYRSIQNSLNKIKTNWIAFIDETQNKNSDITKYCLSNIFLHICEIENVLLLLVNINKNINIKIKQALDKNLFFVYESNKIEKEILSCKKKLTTLQSVKDGYKEDAIYFSKEIETNEKKLKLLLKFQTILSNILCEKNILLNKIKSKKIYLDKLLEDIKKYLIILSEIKKEIKEDIEEVYKENYVQKIKSLKKIRSSYMFDQIEINESDHMKIEKEIEDYRDEINNLFIKVHILCTRYKEEEINMTKSQENECKVKDIDLAKILIKLPKSNKGDEYLDIVNDEKIDLEEVIEIEEVEEKKK